MSVSTCTLLWDRKPPRCTTENTRQIKNTRQIGSLPSVNIKTLGKPASLPSVKKNTRQIKNTWQIGSLPSVNKKTLGKPASLPSVKKKNWPKRRLCRVQKKKLGKKKGLRRFFLKFGKKIFFFFF